MGLPAEGLKSSTGPLASSASSSRQSVSEASATNRLQPAPSFRALPLDASDRIFPLRSIVNVEPYPCPRSPGVDSSASICGSASRQNSAVGTPITEDSYFGVSGSSSSPGPRRNSASASGSTKDPVDGQETASVPHPGEVFASAFVTARHRHVMSEDGHMIIAGIDGAESIQRCEDEPIHIPGAVQGFGCMVALREQDEGILDIRVVSENSKEIIGCSPSELFEIGNFLKIFSDEQAKDFMDHLEFVKKAMDPRIDGPEVFSLIVTGRDAIQIKLWCAVHMPENSSDLFVCEFELEDDHKFPLNPSYDHKNPQCPTETLSSEPTDEEFLESTLSTNRPLRISRYSRDRRGEAAALEAFSLMGQIQEQMASAKDLATFLKLFVGITKELTGYHRVMIYQFDKQWNGSVVNELVDPCKTKDLYKGLHFPASDIPAQARALYKINKVRLLYDRDQTTARLVCKTQEDLDKPVDLTHSYLRAMSPIHLKYLGNMEVRGSMSISITAFDQLWGLVTCHSYGTKGMRVSFPTRKMCRLIGEAASRSIERLSYASRLAARKLINTIPTEHNPGGYIVASSDDLLRLFDADCGLLSIRDETQVLGKLEHSQEALTLLEYLRIKSYASVLTSQNLVKDFPDLKREPGFNILAGFLLVPLSPEGQDFIVFFRKPQSKHVYWAGNPYEKSMKEGTESFLEPRGSFKIWSETVLGESREWTEDQVEMAAVLCLVYGRFIEVWRQKGAALRNTQLTRLLLANASHEVRTPLNAIINCLEIALESPLDSETRENLERSHSASKSLIYVINDLLDLARTEVGQDLIKDEVFDLRKLVIETTGMFKVSSGRKGLSFEITEYPGLPPLVKGDPIRLRQVLSNVIDNAVQHTTQGGLKIEVSTGETQHGTCEIQIAVEDTGKGISSKNLDILFGELEQIHAEDDIDSSGAGKDNASFNALSRIPGQRMLGLGLAVVARCIRNMKGQLRLKSEEGKGSRFTLSLPFKLPSEFSGGFTNKLGVKRNSPPPAKGEVTLISPRKFPSTQPSVDSTQIDIAASRADRPVDTVSSPPSGGASSAATEYCLVGPSSTTLHSSLPPDGSQPVRLDSTGRLPLNTPLFEKMHSTTPAKKAASSSTSSVWPVRSNYDGIPVPSGAVVSLPPPPPPPTLVRPVSQVTHSSIDTSNLTILVAEDDPINGLIIKKRLEMMGHAVTLTANGEECYENFLSSCLEYDAVLMDMQMPIMDGGTSARRIRKFESTLKQPISARHVSYGRVPIFAVSASLIEERRTEYMKIGFDGWIHKPVDFQRVRTIFEGMRKPQIRRDTSYTPGKWEQGGWFLGSGDLAGPVLAPVAGVETVSI